MKMRLADIEPGQIYRTKDGLHIKVLEHLDYRTVKLRIVYRPRDMALKHNNVGHEWEAVHNNDYHDVLGNLCAECSKFIDWDDYLCRQCRKEIL